MPARKKADKENNPTLAGTRKPRASAGNRTRAAKAEAATVLQQKKATATAKQRQANQRKQSKKRTNEALEASNPGDGEDARLVELQTKLNEALAEQDRQKRRAERYRAERDRDQVGEQGRKRKRASDGAHASPLPQRLTRPTGITDIQEKMRLGNDNELYASILAQLKDIFKQSRGAVDKTWATQDLEVRNKIRQTALGSIPYLKTRCPWAVDMILTQYLYNSRKYIKAKADPNSILNQRRAARLSQSKGDPGNAAHNDEGPTEATDADSSGSSDSDSDSNSSTDSASTGDTSPPKRGRNERATNQQPTSSAPRNASCSKSQRDAARKIDKPRRLPRLSK